MLHYRIYVGNSNNVPHILSDSLHFIFTSPPYGLKKLITYDSSNPENLGNYEKEEYLNLMKPIYKECFRILKSGRKMIVNITDAVAKNEEDDKAIHYRTGNKTVDILEEIGFTLEDTVIWDKGQSIGFHTDISNRPGSAVLTHRYEFCFILRKPGPTDWSHLTEEEREAGKLPKDFMGKYLYNLWSVDTETQKSYHPAPFPLQLPKIGIRLFTFPNEIVYDPFLGTGTTIKAAMELQRSAYGTEIGYIPTTKDKEGNKIPDGTNWLDRTKAEINWGNSNLASDEIIWKILTTEGQELEKLEVKGLGRDKLMEESLHSKGQNLFTFGLEVQKEGIKRESTLILPSGEGEWEIKPEDWKKQKTL